MAKGNPNPVITPEFISNRAKGTNAAFATLRRRLIKLSEQLLVDPKNGMLISKRDKILHNIIDGAVAGDPDMIKLYVERIDGKAVQGIVMASGDAGLPTPAPDNADGTAGGPKPVALVFMRKGDRIVYDKVASVNPNNMTPNEAVAQTVAAVMEQQDEQQEVEARPMLDITPPAPGVVVKAEPGVIVSRGVEPD